jgi:ligand-binding sensor domain-containing protein
MKNICLSKLFSCFVLLLSACTSTVYAQPIRLNFKHITKNDGLVSSNVLSVVQDYKGIMWFGTIEGLCRYDGTNFIKYSSIPADPTSLNGFYIKSILEDHNKNLLIGTDIGLSQYNRDLDCFLNYKLDKSSALYNIQLNIRKITEDSIGNLWIATAQGLIYFDRKNNKVIQYLHDLNNPNSISDNNVENVYIDSRGRVWVSTWNGLDLFNRETGKFELVNYSGINNINNAGTIFLEVIEDREGNIWFGSTDGLYCLENKSIKGNIYLINYKNIPGNPNSISNNRIKSLFIDSNNNFWIGTENGGLNLFDRDKKQFIHYRMDEFNPMSLNNESIQAITQVRVGNIWVCTFGGGVNVTF